MSAIVIPNAHLEGVTKAGDFVAVIPKAFVPGMEEVIRVCQAHHAGYGKLTLDRPFKPRTHGPRKQNPDDPTYQNNMLNGFLSQLAIHFGYTKTEMKEVMKDDVPEWPTEPRRIGKRVKVRPVSEADVSASVAAKAIDWCIMIAAEEGMVLKTWKETEGEGRA